MILPACLPHHPSPPPHCIIRASCFKDQPSADGAFSLSSPFFFFFSPFPGLRKHDVCFLVTVRPNLPYGTRFDRRQPFVEQTGLAYVRGCEVQGMLDDKGRVIEEGRLARAHTDVHTCTSHHHRHTHPAHTHSHILMSHALPIILLRPPNFQPMKSSGVVMVTLNQRTDLFALTFH